MPVYASLAVVLAAAVLAGWGMWHGWRSRAARDADLPAPPMVPADPGPSRLAAVEATYVSTTRAGDWLARVVAHDLGARAAATVAVHDAGVLVRRTGAPDLFLPAADLRGVDAAPGQAGKVVGGHGLVRLTWSLGGTAVDTALRTRYRADHDALLAAAAGLLPTTPEEAA